MPRSPISALCVGVAALRAGALLLDDVVRLPDVDTLMVGAQDSVNEFKREAVAMRKEIESSQRASQNLLARRRKEMEENLTLLDARIADVQRRNSKVQKHIDELVNTTQEQRATVRRWKTSNDFMREALSAFQLKMQVVHEFLMESVNITAAPAGVRELAVLRQTTQPPTVETFLRVLQGEDDGTADDKVSLLSTDNAEHARAQLQQQQNPHEVGLPDIGQHIQELAEMDSRGEAQLMGTYIAKREMGDERLRQAQVDGQALLTREAELVNTSQSLKLAIAHLKEANADLLHRTSGMRRFAVQTYADNERVSKLSAKALEEAMGRAEAVRSSSNVTTAANATAAAHSSASTSEAATRSQEWSARGRERRHERWAKSH